MATRRRRGFAAVLSGMGLALFLGALPSAAFALDRNQVRFRTVDIELGLSSSTARDLAQDASGQIWVGTQDGLNRFDGYSFTVFAHDPANPDSLAGDHVTRLAVAPDDQLWVGTVTGGLSLLDLPTGRFSRFAGAPAGPLASNHVADLLVDRKGALWVATVDGGLQRRARGDRAFANLAGDPACLGAVRDLLELANGDVLVACADRILRIDGASSAAADWPGSRHAAWPGDFAPVALAEMPDGRVLVGDARAGLVERAADGALLAHHRHDPANPESLVDDQVTRLLVTRRGELWIGTFQGLSHHLGGNRFVNFRHDAADNASLPANRIPSLLEDRSGLIIVGTWTRGIAFHNPATRSLRLLRHRQGDAASLPSNPVRTMFRDGDGSLWLGLSEGGGLVRLDAGLSVVERHVHDPVDPGSLPDNAVQAILRRRNGELWVATANGGVAWRAASGGPFQRLRGAGQGLEVSGSRALLETADGTLWVGTDDAGVLARCAGCTRFERVPGLPGNFVNALHADGRGRVWIGYNGAGLARFGPDSGAVDAWRAQPGVAGALPSDVISDLMETRSGDLWLATQGGGIARVDETGTAPRFDALGKADGLSANAIGSLIEDIDGRIWVASIVGIDELDPRTRKVRNLLASDGFDRSGYFIGSNTITPKGEVFFGGLLGLVMFDPRDFRASVRPPGVTLTEFAVFGGRGGQSGGRVGTNAAWLGGLELAPGESIWRIGFSTMEFLGPQHARYQFRLVGLNDAWLDLPDGQHAATFTHVPAGTYTFAVRAQAAGGDFGPETTLPVTILAPWWRRPWALAAYAIGTVLVLATVAWRVRRNFALRARQQAIVAASERRLKSSLWGSRDELWDFDVSSGQVRRENPLPGLFAPEWREGGHIRALAEAIHPDDLAPLEAALVEHLKGRSEFFEATFRARNDRGEWIWCLQRGKAVEHDAEGRPTHLIGTTRDITSVKQVEEALRVANEQLEARVAARTHELTEANAELKDALARLRDTQSQLIESEKLASLGGLVAGVAHEINTPLGICITAASHLKQATEMLQRRQAQGELTRSGLAQFEQDALEAARLILKNLERAAHLVRSFKQVAVDQGSEERRTINLGQYLEEVVFALNPMLKRTPHRIQVACPPEIVLDTWPGAIYQIVANFVGNAITHAFPDGRSGTMSVLVRRLPEARLEIVFSDDGVGASPEVLRRIFEPFFTTRRGSGGSGLGLHIVYNLVTTLLKGTITVENGPGLRFRILLPPA